MWPSALVGAIAIGLSSPATGPPFDVVVLGATGFTGRIAARYLATRYGADSPVRWAIAGRNAAKLAEVKCALPNGADVPSLICDTSDAAAVDELVRSTKAIANYAGSPFLDKALPVVEACARRGVHYVDITAELPLQRTSYDQFHAECVRSGALVVHACGFDSVPSDLSAFLAARALRAKCGEAPECRRLQVYVANALGGFSGGTLATGAMLMGGGAEGVPGAADAARRGSYSLDPEGGVGGPDRDDFGPVGPVGYDADAGTWTTASVMAAVNMPVVRKTNALLGYPYGKRVRVGECTDVQSPLVAAALLPLLAAGAAAVGSPPAYEALTSVGLLPKPGEGPAEWLMERGFFHVYALAIAADEGAARSPAPSERVGRADIFSAPGWGDPGYRGTALMSVESALTLALDRHACAAREGGVLTPAAAMGDALVRRLTDAGMRFEVQ
ncbi:hypothetical protein KFE25_008449 [Diacronema lutheri]|uniref:Saccharopine dehydrogenase NADP binding domain-containing protein n=1 Tax=Diacronema lutheri TaxID=2081491 RepID=A0A8J5X8W5_DIALT|nr:hypothetical protein KFE25_008449 [Diacronema lutheri]